jgi:histidyl-tRNA synthetase
MQELEMIPPTKTTADILIIQFDQDRLNDYLKIATQLRTQGIGVEIFPSAKKLNQQFKYADRRGYPIVLIAGGNEFESNMVKLKAMADGSESEVPLSDDCTEIIEWIRNKV